MYALLLLILHKNFRQMKVIDVIMGLIALSMIIKSIKGLITDDPNIWLYVMIWGGIWLWYLFVCPLRDRQNEEEENKRKFI